VRTQQPLADRDGTHDEGFDQALHRFARKDDVQIDSGRADVERGDRHLGLSRTSQLDLRFFREHAQAPECDGVVGVRPRHRDVRLRGDALHEVVDDGRIEVAPAEEIVAVVSDHAQEPFLRLQQGYVERPAAEIVHEPRSALFVGLEARRDRRGDRLLDELDAVEAGEPRGFTRRGVLRQLEERRHADHGARG
jgi:hypothetical protein